MTEKEALKSALEAYLCREMPAGTVIGDPKWWAAKIANAIKAALAQPEQMPVGFVDSKLNPIQRTWVSLTDEEMMQIYIDLKSVAGFYSVEKYAQAIEAKLKEKNV